MRYFLYRAEYYLIFCPQLNPVWYSIFIPKDLQDPSLQKLYAHIYSVTSFCHLWSYLFLTVACDVDSNSFCFTDEEPGIQEWITCRFKSWPSRVSFPQILVAPSSFSLLPRPAHYLPFGPSCLPSSSSFSNSRVHIIARFLYVASVCRDTITAPYCLGDQAEGKHLLLLFNASCVLAMSLTSSCLLYAIRSGSVFS